MSAQEKKKKYAAFISYRHLSPDMEIARALARMLEHNMVRPNRKVKRNIAPVFLDVNELPLTESLDGSIIHALDESEMLIVVCSPNLPLSKYCMREISYFKEIHGGRTDRIYTLLADGDPMEAFPEILRQNEVHSFDKDGNPIVTYEPVEPLFADVRAPTIKESLKKLRSKEYIRLAAAYYRCSFDDLYKRRKRWLWKIGLSSAAAAGALAVGFNIYAYTQDLQYNAAKAATYASYARAQSEQGNELLALTLCDEAWEEAQFSHSASYMTALRSAAVQYDYKLRAEPITSTISIPYMEGPQNDTVFYISSNDQVSIVQADGIYQITDSHTGAILLQFPKDLLKLDANDVNWYVTIAAETDENGVLQDTLQFWSLEDQKLLNSFAMRPSSQEQPQYQLYPQGPVLEIRDGDQVLAWIDRQGHRLTEEEKDALQQQTAAAKKEAVPFVYSPGSTGIKKAAPSIKNAADEVVLTLPARNLSICFSDNWQYFSYAYENTLYVYDTSDWTAPAALLPLDAAAFSALSGQLLQAEHFGQITLLGNSTYVMLTYHIPETQASVDLIFDWSTHQFLLACTGTPYKDYFTDGAFYLLGNGLVTRYQYNDMDLSSTTRIAAQKGDLYLTRTGDTVALFKGSNVIFRTESFKESHEFDADRIRMQYSDNLSRILIRQRDGLACYDQEGTILWQAPYNSRAFALSKNGALAAYLDEEGNAHVISAADGKELYVVPASSMTSIARPDALAVSSAGLCICEGIPGQKSEEDAMWFPAGSVQGIDLGRFCQPTLYEDGTLILSGSAYVMDFALWDVKTQRFLFQPTGNTGAWAYSPKTGYLVRHLETSGSHASLELEISQLKKGQIIQRGRIALPNMSVDALRLDDQGEYLSFTAGSYTRIYRLQDLSAILETTNLPLYLEEGCFYSSTMQGGLVYAMPLLSDDELHAFALSLITSPAGTRTLTLAEQARYSFD